MTVHRCGLCGTLHDSMRSAMACCDEYFEDDGLDGAAPVAIPDGGTDARTALKNHGTLFANVQTQASSVDTVHVDRDCPQLVHVTSVRTITDVGQLPLRADVCETCTGTAAVADSPDWSIQNALSEATSLDDLRTDGGQAVSGTYRESVIEHTSRKHLEVREADCLGCDETVSRLLDTRTFEWDTLPDRCWNCGEPTPWEQGLDPEFEGRNDRNSQPKSDREPRTDGGATPCGRRTCNDPSAVDYTDERGRVRTRCELHALEDGVKGVGSKRAAQILAKVDLDRLVELCTDADGVHAPPTLSRLSGFGPTTAATIAKHVDESPVASAVRAREATPIGGERR